ncbi:hypothetical protein O181_024362 [Austropuccinia psidii MF-1]|uniref:RNase H type-1 domain-containing protein n=1 Tax=Austropuccinia psidii MF-1 TaxID=1389203 RepID=A0A9Q3GYX2_9BASI|nr:hypothetical protein [Austropuccinia psidii MF-1]
MNRMTNKYFGLNSKDTRLLIKAVLYPRILLGSIIWWNNSNDKKINKIMKLIYNKAARLIMRAQKSTPISFLKWDSGLNSLRQTHIKHAHITLAKLYTKDNQHPTKHLIKNELTETEITHHPSTIHKLVERDKIINALDTQIETINTYAVPPWNIPLEVFNLNNDKAQAKTLVLEALNKQGPDTLAIFTDGSDIPDRGKRAVAIILNNNMIIKRHMLKETKISNYETEIIGLSLAVEAAKREIYKRRDNGETVGKIYIFCDNQGALRKVADPTTSSSAQYLYLKTHQEFKTLKNLVTTYLWWCPGHFKIEGNDKADKAAKEAALDNTMKTQQVKHSLSK